MKDMNKPSALHIADYHWRDSQPLCRGDDFITALINTTDFIHEICERYDIPLIIAGDVFDHWKPSPSLLRMAIEHMPTFIAIPGQHDLPQHNLRLHEQSGLSVLEAACVAIVLEIFLPETIWPKQSDWVIVGFPYGSEPSQILGSRYQQRRKICMIHQLVSGGTSPFPNAKAASVRSLLRKLPDYDLILSGDNHQRFTFEYNNRRVVNPGSVFRTKADQIDHKPAAYDRQRYTAS
jgi:DNA repair exonuclease SbcCD nuclease subunit